MYRKTILVLLAVAAIFAAPMAVQAKKPPKAPKSSGAFSASLYGGAVQEPNDVKLVSDLTDTNTANDFSGIRFSVPSGFTFADLKTLSAEFNPTQGGCGGGSPRFELQLASGKNVFVYFGPSPSFTGCALNTWQSTGNLVGNNDACRYDTSQVQSGTQCNTYAGTLALIGSQAITEIRLVVDSGWFFTPKVQTVLVRNVVVNGQTFFSPGAGKSGLNPAQMCKAQLDSMGAQAFAQLWGSNGNKANAFGKCVSAMAHAQQTHHATQAQQRILGAAQACKALRKSNPAAFRAQFRTLGTCVASKANVSSLVRTTKPTPGHPKKKKGH
jgi:hypothetical protein